MDKSLKMLIPGYARSVNRHRHNYGPRSVPVGSKVVEEKPFDALADILEARMEASNRALEQTEANTDIKGE